MAKKSSKIAALKYHDIFPERTMIELPDGLTVPSYTCVTPLIPITQSGGNTKTVFYYQGFQLPVSDTLKYTISSLPNTDAPIIVDDFIVVNGSKHAGFDGIPVANTGSYLGTNPVTCYQPVPALDISNDLRNDGNIFIELQDLGGIVYASSALYIRVTPKMISLHFNAELNTHR